MQAVNAEFTALSLDPPTSAPVSVEEPAYDLDEELPAAAVHRPEHHEGYGYGNEPRIIEPELEPALAGGASRPEGTDMAALLRELSSLGGAFDSEPGAVPGAPTGGHVVTRPVQAAPDKATKKKKGFFGR